MGCWSSVQLNSRLFYLSQLHSNFSVLAPLNHLFIHLSIYC
jgi:hypothetical protein